MTDCADHGGRLASPRTCDDLESLRLALVNRGVTTGLEYGLGNLGFGLEAAAGDIMRADVSDKTVAQEISSLVLSSSFIRGQKNEIFSSQITRLHFPVVDRWQRPLR